MEDRDLLEFLLIKLCWYFCILLLENWLVAYFNDMHLCNGVALSVLYVNTYYALALAYTVAYIVVIRSLQQLH